jgi:hypothetical protein
MSETMERRPQAYVASWMAAGFVSTIFAAVIAGCVAYGLHLGALTAFFFWAAQIPTGVLASRRGSRQLVAFIAGIFLTFAFGFVVLIWFFTQITF